MADREQDFDLQILKAGDRYRANVLQSPAGEADADFDLPFTGDELDDLFRGLGQARSRTRGAASPEVATATDFGTRLFDKVFSGDVRDCLSNSRGRATSSGANLRIRLRLTKVPELLDLPWELLFDRLARRFLALDGSTTLVRHLPVAEPVVPMRVDPPLRVLVAISNPRGDLDVDLEWAKLSAALDALTSRGLVQVERLQPATFEGLQDKLDAGSFQVLHFVGHGHFDPARKGGYLSFETTASGEKRVGATRLADLLRPHRTLRLVVLNACEGGRTSREDPFAGVAQSLVQSAIPAVVAMQFPVSDAAAVTFAGAFYGGLAAGRPVDLALAAARREVNLKGEEGDIEWATPVLYMRGDGRLFDVSQAAGATATKQFIAPVEPPEKAESRSNFRKTSGQAKEDEIVPPPPPPPPPTKWIKILAAGGVAALIVWGIAQFGQEEERVEPAPPPATKAETPAPALPTAPPKAEPKVAPVPAPAPKAPEALDGKSKAAAVLAALPGSKPTKPYKTGQVFKECPECPEMVVIVPEGDFKIGSPKGESGHQDDEQQSDPIRLAPYAIGRFEVTRAQFEASGGKAGSGCHTWTGAKFEMQETRNWRNPGFEQGDDHPVVCVDRKEARRYAYWLNEKRAEGVGGEYSLPSEAQWEYAARGDTSTARFWGEDPLRACGFANVADRTALQQFSDWTVHECTDGHVFTAPGGGGKSAKGKLKFAPNPFGLHDMLGNVWEWVQDCYKERYDPLIKDGRAYEAQEGCEKRVVRGGSWGSRPESVRSANRDGNVPANRVNLLGFRVARTLP